MAKNVGDWNQCRCGNGYQESKETIEADECLDCILDKEARERQWKRDCLDYGCPFCLTLGCIGACSTNQIAEKP